MIRGSTINLEDILICPSQKDFKLVPYSTDQVNSMILNIMTQFVKTKSEGKRQLLLKIVNDLRLLRDTML